MPIVGSDLATGWSTGYETLFLAQYNQTIAVEMARLNPLVMEIPMGDFQGNTIQLDWLGAVPQMQEWIDEKKAAGLNKNSWSVLIKNYEATVEIDMNAFKDARGNVYEPRIREIAANAGRLPYTLMSDLIALGGTAVVGALCYDGQYFFDTDHSEGDSGAQSNKLTGSGTTQANIETDYYIAKSKLMGYLDDKGIPLMPFGFRPLIIIPNNPTLIQRFNTLRGAAIISQTNNVLTAEFDVITDPRLGTGVDWYMFRTDGMMKPFIFINREPAHYVDDFSLYNPNIFNRRVGKAGAEARAAATFGMWQQAVMIDN